VKILMQNYVVAAGRTRRRHERDRFLEYLLLKLT
jgi:hypothetical protein